MTSDVVVPAAETTAANGRVDAHSTAGFKALMLGSIGVVYGDIGTSPLYAFREAVVAAGGPSGTVSPQAVLGVLSLILGADRRADAEIRADPAARRQPWRGWNAGADGAGATRGRPRRGRDRAARDHQRRAVLRRRGDHAGAIGAFGDRGHQAGDRGIRSVCGAADGDHFAGAVRGAVAWHGAGRRLFRPGDGGLVRCHCDR